MSSSGEMGKVDKIEDILTELGQYQVYFFDKEKNKVLVGWVRDNLRKVGKVLSEAWMKKLQGRLAENSRYFSFSQRLLALELRQ